MASENQDIKVLDFKFSNIPQPIESRNTSDQTFVSYGLNNSYPAFLLDLFTNSGIHGAIVNQKSNYIIGNGLKINGTDDLDIEVNPSDSLKEFTSKIIKDYLLFNYFAVEVIFNALNQPIEFHHVPSHKVRTNKPKTKFWVCDDWLMTRKYITYDRYSVNGNSDTTSKIFFFDGYFPSLNNKYPVPEYAGSIKSITTDIAIVEFNLNNIQGHFSPSTIITYYNGAGNIMDDKVKEQIADNIEQNFKGQSGKKFIIEFQSKDGKAAEVKALSANDWDKAYIQVAESNVSNILIGHQVGNPSLFAIQVPGKLGNTQELEVSYQIFKTNYIEVKRQELETAFNHLFTNYEAIGGKVKFSDKPLFNTQLADDIKVRIYTINELRKIEGLDPLTDGDRLLDAVAAPVPVPTATVDPVVEVQQEEDVKKKSFKVLTEDDYELVKDLGVSFQDFDVIEEVKQHKFDKESDIASFIIDNDIRGLKIGELVDVLKNEGNIKTNIDELDNILNKLNDSGVVKVTRENDRIKVTPNNLPNVPATDEVSVMYRYEKRPEVSGGDLVPNSRGFCVKLINNDRIYTREDIQTMGSIFGYDVYKHTGGFYHNPETGETTNYCRHYWKMLRVKRK